MIAGLSFVGLVIAGLPIAFILLAVAIIYILSSGNTVLLASLPQQLFGGLESYGLLALPLFILLGELMNEGGIGRRLMGLAMSIIGSVRGGLAYVNLLANVMMASILGSTVAQITVMSRMAVPEMDRAGYPRDISAAITAAGGLLAPVIPPSMLFIIYGVVAQISIGDLFVAGVVPGLMMAVSFFVVIAILGRIYNFPEGERYNWSQRFKALCDALPAVIIPVTIIGTILGGIATPTESAVLAIVASVLVGRFVYGELEFSHLAPAFVRAARGAAVVLFLIAAAQVFSWVITFENLPATVAVFLQSLTESPTVFLLLVVALLLVLGMFTDPIPAIILVVPVLLPVATNVYGVDPFHFGMIVCLTLVVGLLTPPVGTGLFTAALMTGVKAERIALMTMPFLMATMAVILAIVFFPVLLKLV